ncbi:hypothetical protein CKO42_26005 [Lamprobacter modestohalophilus]|uniref:Uncharacterized protein n=1 Tax=Lamprobacter modestohalophilus TaxID=1064514 RepID=A0A9X0WE61_9GAMM|nr:hypothetical protein [Lamprobacter modestohalophilus]
MGRLLLGSLLCLAAFSRLSRMLASRYKPLLDRIQMHRSTQKGKDIRRIPDEPRVLLRRAVALR